ncbi:MAG: hypothetical protein JOZ18_02150 [Chloroflexi bacterium]|nr:hypothetical protein [Chloroflexota bacterium]
MKDELISSKPIQELRDNMLNPASFARFQYYLEKECGCACTMMADRSVVVRFPEGTLEQEYAGGSSTWRRETVICLPNGVRLIKRVYPPTVYPPMMEEGKALVALVLPAGALVKRVGKEGIQGNEKSKEE